MTVEVLYGFAVVIHPFVLVLYIILVGDFLSTLQVHVNCT